MSASASDFIDRFNDIAHECQRMCYITRARELQVEALDRAMVLKQEIMQVKQEAILRAEEEPANTMLCFEKMIDALINELEMWIALKDDQPDKAWECLVRAQLDARSAVQAHSRLADILNVLNYFALLEAKEKILFPNHGFFSPAIVIKRGECSICHQEYGACNHIVGRPYMGELCSQIITEVDKIVELSIVFDPANKMNRITRITENGITRDTLTWRQAPIEDTEQAANE